ncbi:MAG: hypothetical protein JNK82_09105 [Myxococcaceae bacterium]|nr:hypothetical protein [Myxococcaceae bacterium]
MKLKRKAKPIKKVRTYLTGLMRRASRQKKKVLKNARSAMERLYGR